MALMFVCDAVDVGEVNVVHCKPACHGHSLNCVVRCCCVLCLDFLRWHGAHVRVRCSGCWGRQPGPLQASLPWTQFELCGALLLRFVLGFLAMAWRSCSCAMQWMLGTSTWSIASQPAMDTV